MTNKLKYDFLEYSSTNTEAIYLVKPLTIEELKRRYPNLKGVSFDLSKTAFSPLKIDHQQYVYDVISAFQLVEIIFSSIGRLTYLPDNIWTENLTKFALPWSSRTNFEISPNEGFVNNLESLNLLNCSYIHPNILTSLTLKEVSISGYIGDISSLSKSPNLENLRLYRIENNGHLKFENFHKIQEIDIAFYQSTNDIIIQHTDQTTAVSLNDCQLDTTNKIVVQSLKNLTKLRLSNLGKNAECNIEIKNLPKLDYIEISNCNIDFDKSFQLKDVDTTQKENTFLSYQITKVYYHNSEFHKLIPDFLLQENLLELRYHNTHANEVPSKLFQCKNLTTLYLELANIHNFGTGWQNFRQLTTVTIKGSNYTHLPDFNSFNLFLNEINLEFDSAQTLPDNWSDCPNLENIRIKSPINELPQSWYAFKSLKNLRIENYNSEKKVCFKREIFTLPNLQTLIANGISHVEILKLLSKHGATQEQRLIFAYIILESKEDLTEATEFRRNLLNAINLGSDVLKDIIRNNLHLICDKSPLESLLKTRGTTICVSGKTKASKAYYKEKFANLNLIFLNKIIDNVDIIVIGDSVPELSEGFLLKKHIFCSEAEIEEQLKNIQPGFLQDVESKDLQSLRNLIWSNDPANEKLVLEMIKKGGIHQDIIPDLMVIAKSSDDKNLRNDFRKILNPKLSTEQKKILSNTRDIDRIFEMYNNFGHIEGFDQMLVCHYWRTKKHLETFFKIKSSCTNMFRTQLFEKLLPFLLQKPHYLNLRYILTNKELDIILSKEILKGNLKRIIFATNENYLPDELFNHKTLNQIEARVPNLDEITHKIGQLEKLQLLHLSGGEIYELPSVLLKIKSIKKISIVTTVQPKDFLMDEALKDVAASKLRVQTAKGNLNYI